MVSLGVNEVGKIGVSMRPGVLHKISKETSSCLFLCLMGAQSKGGFEYWICCPCNRRSSADCTICFILVIVMARGGFGGP